MNDHALPLPGLDGGNPLAFLAALGTLRALSHAWPDRCVRMSWQSAGGWRPVLHVSSPATPDEVVARLLGQMQDAAAHPSLHLADNLTLTRPAFAEHLHAQLEQCHALRDAAPLAYAAAFGSDVIGDEKMADTALRTMSGAGHQHFLATMRAVLTSATAERVTRTLFQPWDYADPLEKLSLRFDPLDDKRYAHRWSNPSGDPTRRQSGNMVGANALAVLGIPCLPTVPVGSRLETVGFQGHRSDSTFWTWPVWNVPLTCTVVGALLACADLQTPAPDRSTLMARGVVEVYRSQRITVGKFRSFAPAATV